MDDQLVRTYRRIFQAARGAGLHLGPVMSPDDFERWPEVLADVVEEAVDLIPEDMSERPVLTVHRLEDLLGDLRDAASSVEAAIQVARARKATANAKGVPA